MRSFASTHFCNDYTVVSKKNKTFFFCISTYSTGMSTEVKPSFKGAEFAEVCFCPDRILSE